MSDLKAAIKTLRDGVRYHRDQKGDDRCWVDDYRLWSLLSDTPSRPTSLPPYEEMMRRCTAFYRYRRAEMPDPLPADAVVDSAQWDMDLESMSNGNLEQECTRLEEAIRAHRDIKSRQRTLEDDRQLYSVLPEQLPADFRLPSEEDFLGEARAPLAGCPSFWRSHQHCSTDIHDIHHWGPCENEQHTS